MVLCVVFVVQCSEGNPPPLSQLFDVDFFFLTLKRLTENIAVGVGIPTQARAFLFCFFANHFRFKLSDSS